MAVAGDDVMELSIEADLGARLQEAFEQSLARFDVAKIFLNRMIEPIKTVRPMIQIDAVTGSPSIQLERV
jgi:hypothetical protein